MQHFKALVVLLVFATVCISLSDAWQIGKKNGKRKRFLSFLVCSVVGFNPFSFFVKYMSMICNKINKIACSILPV